MSHKNDLINFVKGMLLHDIAKPLYLGSEKHSIRGYVLLNALGKEDEALVALSHHQQLEVYFKHQVEPGQTSVDKLPSYLALTSPIDRISSVT